MSDTEVKEVDLSKYPDKIYHTSIPYGYMFATEVSDDAKEGGDPYLPSVGPEKGSRLVPDPEVISLLENAFDQLDAGTSLRNVAEWLNTRNTKANISHTGLNLLRKQYRPNFVKQRQKRPQKDFRLYTPEERESKKRRYQLSQEKKRITAALKRKEKLEKQIGILKENTIDISSSLIELDYSAPEYQEIEKDEIQVIFKPNPGPQTEFFMAEELEVLYGGSAGSGKSYALLADPMRYFSNKHFRGLILRRTNDELRELIWKSQELYLQAFPGAVWREKDKEWRLPSGARLWMTYLEREDDVHRYQGQAFTYIAFDELTQYPTPFAWNYMRSRLRDASGTLPLFMRATSNPGGPGHGWVKRMFIDPAPWGTAFKATDIETGVVMTYPKGHAKEGQPLFERRFIPARLTDNPYLYKDGVYESNLMSLPEAQQRQLLYGDWDVADGAAFPEFRQSLHVVEPYEIPHSWRRFRSCDFGYSTRQASAVHWYAINPSTGQLIVYRELYVNQHTGAELARKVLDLEKNESISYGVLDSSVWSVRGQSGPSIAEEMIHTGCRWKPSDRTAGSRVAGKNRLHELLRPDPWTKLPGIVFFNTCRQIISDLPVIPNDKDSDDIDSKYATDHAYDSIRYGIMSRPKLGGNDNSFETLRAAPRFVPADSRFGY